MLWKATLSIHSIPIKSGYRWPMPPTMGRLITIFTVIPIMKWSSKETGKSTLWHTGKTSSHLTIKSPNGVGYVLRNTGPPMSAQIWLPTRLLMRMFQIGVVRLLNRNPQNGSVPSLTTQLKQKWMAAVWKWLLKVRQMSVQKTWN